MRVVTGDNRLVLLSEVEALELFNKRSRCVERLATRHHSRAPTTLCAAPHAEFAKHNHRCLAIAYTLGGLWGYREGEELHFPGTFSYEPPGSIHTPYSTADGMFLYGSFQGDSDVMLDILDADDKVIDQLKLNFFAKYYDGK